MGRTVSKFITTSHVTRRIYQRNITKKTIAPGKFTWKQLFWKIIFYWALYVIEEQVMSPTTINLQRCWPIEWYHWRTTKSAIKNAFLTEQLPLADPWVLKWKKRKNGAHQILLYSWLKCQYIKVTCKQPSKNVMAQLFLWIMSME